MHSVCYYVHSETVKNEYREMIASVKAAWSLVGHRLKNHGNVMLYHVLRIVFLRMFVHEFSHVY